MCTDKLSKILTLDKSSNFIQPKTNTYPKYCKAVHQGWIISNKAYPLLCDKLQKHIKH